MILVIDDLRNFRNEVVMDVEAPIFTMRSSHEALTWLDNFILLNIDKQLVIEQLWLDHDLGILKNNDQQEDLNDTTIPFVEELIKLHNAGKHVEIGTVIVHSSNPVGVRNIMNKLRPIYPNIIQVEAHEYFVV